LGHGGDNEVKNHLWFKGFRWDKLYRMELKSPFIPPEEESENTVYVPPIDNEQMRRFKKIMNSKEYKTAFKNFLFFNLYDKNLNHEKYKNPHEIYETQLIHKIKDRNKNNNDIECDKDDNIKKEKEKMKSFNQPIKNKFNYMDIFNRKNYDFFEKSQNIPNINKYFKNDI